MKTFIIAVERNKLDTVVLCHTWRGALTWTMSNNRALVLPENAANELMIAIRDIVPENWRLYIEPIEASNLHQHLRFYLENMPNV